jgi:hypothetical protein
VVAFLLLGFVVGLRHALEADHVAAVVSLATRGGSLRSQAAQGALWGLGHTLTLLAVAGTCIGLGLSIPAGWERAFETIVGGMLVVLGISVFARLRRERIRFHPHHHADGTFHVHAHKHVAGSHVHVPLRALLVGSVHGLAGSAALVVVVAGSARSPLLGLLHVALFGVGSILGMSALAATVAVPLGASARFHAALCAAAGTASLALGASRIWAFAHS